MMNGTDSSFGAFGKHRDITDTQVIFEIMDYFKVPLEALTELSPRFMGFKDGKVFATNPSGYQGLEYQEIDNAICIASEFPIDYVDVKKLKRNFVWIEGEKLVEEKIKVYQSTKNWYGKSNEVAQYENYWWFDQYDKQKKQEETYIDEEIDKEFKMSVFKNKLRIAISLIEEDKSMKMIDAQDFIDETFGISPIVDNKYHYITVLEGNQVIVQNEDGDIIDI